MLARMYETALLFVFVEASAAMMYTRGIAGISINGNYLLNANGS